MTLRMPLRVPSAMVLAMALIASACVCSFIGGGTAWADGAAESKRLSNLAAADFKAGNLPAAEEKWEAAYKAAPDPTILFALGRCYAADNKPDKSVAALREFLDKSPKSTRRAEVQKLIKEQEAKVAEQVAARPDPAPAPPPEPAPSPPVAEPAAPLTAAPVDAGGEGGVFGRGLLKKWWLWTAVGGVVVAGVAVGLGVGLTRNGSTFPDVGPGLSSALVEF